MSKTEKHFASRAAVKSLTLCLSALSLISAVTGYASARPRYVVVIDPGHGGRDPGAIGLDKGESEKSITLTLALVVRDELSYERNIWVTLTRSTDRFVTLVGRRHVAEANHADLFLSIHADSSTDPRARGASIYTLREDGRPVVVRRIALEDRVDGVAMLSLGPDVAAVLGNLAERAAMNDSADFAVRLAAVLEPVIAMRSEPRLSAHFAVLKAQGIPAVLLETGYVTNSKDGDVLFTDRGRKRIAKAIAKAIVQTADGIRYSQATQKVKWLHRPVVQ